MNQDQPFLLVYFCFYLQIIKLIKVSISNYFYLRYYAACIYSALSSLHENAVISRFVNSNSVYITDRGVPKLVGEFTSNM